MKKLESVGADIATYSEGTGTPVIFLHGGPGDTHHYMKRLAQPLFQDLKIVQEYYSKEPARVVGHSWGAMYALFGTIKAPESFCKAALLNMGPLDDEMGKQTNENLLSHFTEAEKKEWSQ